MRTWYDNKAGIITKTAMHQGIEHSQNFCLFLSPSVFKSLYVKFEIAVSPGACGAVQAGRTTYRTGICPSCMMKPGRGGTVLQWLHRIPVHGCKWRLVPRTRLGPKRRAFVVGGKQVSNRASWGAPR